MGFIDRHFYAGLFYIVRKSVYSPSKYVKLLIFYSVNYFFCFCALLLVLVGFGSGGGGGGLVWFWLKKRNKHKAFGYMDAPRSH